MAIAYSTAGTAGEGTTSAVITLPATLAAEDLVLIALVSRYPGTATPDTPSGWTLASRHSGGSGAAGIDSGDVYCSVYSRVIESSTEGGGTVTFTHTSGNAIRGQSFRFTKSGSKRWSVAATGGSDNTTGTAWSVTMDSDPGITTDDLVAVFTATNSDLGTVSTHALSATGVTFGTVTERHDSTTGQGDDASLSACTAPVTAGPSSAAAVYTATRSGSAANSHCGASVLVRLREVDSSYSADGTSTAAMEPPNTASSFSSDGNATASATGNANFLGVFSADGTATASATGNANFLGVFSVDGTAAASATGNANFLGVFSADGTATAEAIGIATSVGGFSADGVSTAAMEPPFPVISADGTSTAAMVGQSLYRASFSAAGTSTTIAVPAAFVRSRYHATARVLDYIGTVKN